MHLFGSLERNLLIAKAQAQQRGRERKIEEDNKSIDYSGIKRLIRIIKCVGRYREDREISLQSRLGFALDIKLIRAK